MKGCLSNLRYLLLVLLMGPAVCFAAESGEADCLKVLAGAKSVQTEILNQATRSTIFAAYKQALKLRLDPMGKELDDLMKNGSPAGRIYACFIAWELDYPAGLARFEKLRKDDSKVLYRGGCTIEETTVSKIASEFVAQHHYKDFPTSIFCKLPMKIDPEKDKPYLKTLREAKLLSTGIAGEGGGQPAEFGAYLEAARKGAGIKGSLEEIVRKGSPAGKIYAAALVYAIDHDRGMALLQELEKCGDNLTFQSGCKVSHDTVANAARSLRTTGNYLGFTLGAK